MNNLKTVTLPDVADFFMILKQTIAAIRKENACHIDFELDRSQHVDLARNIDQRLVYVGDRLIELAESCAACGGSERIDVH